MNVVFLFCGKVGEVGMKTATISFLPVCSECKIVIWREINCVRNDEADRLLPLGEKENSRIIIPDYVVTPEHCPNCGAVFTGISIPTRLPFDNNRVY